MKVKSLSRVRPLATPWTAAYQAPPPWDLPGKSTGVGCHCLLGVGCHFLLDNAGDPGSIPGLGRSPGEGIGYPIQYSWASLVAQLVNNPPAMQETSVPSLGWEDLLEKG